MATDRVASDTLKALQANAKALNDNTKAMKDVAREMTRLKWAVADLNTNLVAVGRLMKEQDGTEDSPPGDGS